MLYYRYTLIMGILAVFLLLGCTPSSNTLRYKSQTEQTTSVDSNIRFTSAEVIEKDPPNYTTGIDSSNIEEISEEFDSEEFPDEEESIDISSIMQKISSQNNSTNTVSDNTYKEKMLMEIIKYLNTPYRYGGTTKDGIDCSAFTQAVYLNSFKISLLRSARDQFTQGFNITDRDELEFGDLVFFNTRRRVRPGHVGVYIGDNLFAHSSTKNGVIVSSLDHEYYSKRFMGGRRLDGLLEAKM